MGLCAVQPAGQNIFTVLSEKSQPGVKDWSSLHPARNIEKQVKSCLGLAPVRDGTTAIFPPTELDEIFGSTYSLLISALKMMGDTDHCGDKDEGKWWLFSAFCNT